MTVDNYDPAGSLSAYYPSRAGRVLARIWAREKTLHDWADFGAVRFFEGGGSDPTALSGYATDKLWLRVDEGVTDEAATVRYYAGGPASLLASWPELDREGFAAHLGAKSAGELDIVWSTAISGDPGTGKVRGNHATLASITSIAISKTGRQGQSYSARIALMDDDDIVRVYGAGDDSSYVDVRITGAPSEQTTYYTIPCAVRAATSLSDGHLVGLSHHPTATAIDTAQDWAAKIDGAVDGANGYSSKAWAIGGTGVTNTAARGSAKDWATKAEDSTVDGSGYSALHHAAKASAQRVLAETARDLSEGYRDAAETARDLSEGYRDAALTAKAAAELAEASAVSAQSGAESARDAAFANANVYADVATGRAAVADGAQFVVIVGDEAIRYRRDSSTTQTEVARYPTSARVRIVNAMPDPFGERLEDVPVVNLVQPRWVGALTRPSSYSFKGKTGIVGAGSVTALRADELASIGAYPGEQWTFGVAFNAAGGSNTVAIQFMNAANASTGATTIASGVAAGYSERFASVTIPANSVYFRITVAAATDKEILAVSAARGTLSAPFAYGAQSNWHNPARGYQKLNADPFFRLAASGQATDDFGYPLIGASSAGPSLVAPPAQSPFGNRHVFLPSGNNIIDFKSEFARSGARVGETVYLTFGVVAKVAVQLTAQVRKNSDSSALVTLTPRNSPPTTGTFSYFEVSAPFTVTSAMLAEPTHFFGRLQGYGGALTDGLYICGWSIQKTPGLLSDDRAADDKIAISAWRGTAKLNPDPFFRLAAAGQTVDGDGYLLIGGASAYTPTLVNAPAGSPFSTKAVAIAAGNNLLDLYTSFANVGARLGETFYVTLGVVAKVGVTAYTRVQKLSDLSTVGPIITSTGSPPVLGTHGYMEIVAPITVTQDMLDNPAKIFVRVQSTLGAGLTDGAWLVGWSVQKSLGPLMDDRGAIDSVAIQAVNAAKSSLAGKKVVFLGDSLIELSSIHAKFGSLTGSTVYKVGFGGCAMAQRTAGTPSSYDQFSFALLADAIVTGDFTAQWAANAALSGPPTNDDNTAQLTLLESLDFDEIDVLVVGYMANDFYSNVALGSDADTVKTTYKGAINSGVASLQAAYPNLEIVFYSQTWHARNGSGAAGQPDSDVDVSPNTAGLYVVQYVDAMIASAARHHVPSIDLFRTAGINKYNHATFLSDGAHLTIPAGEDRVAGRLAAAVKSKL